MNGQVQQLLGHLQAFPKLTYLLFSATISSLVEQFIKELTCDMAKVFVGGKNSVLASIEQRLVYCQSEYGKLLEVKRLINEGQFEPPVLIFVQSKSRAAELLDEIARSAVHLTIKAANINAVSLAAFHIKGSPSPLLRTWRTTNVSKSSRTSGPGRSGA